MSPASHPLLTLGLLTRRDTEVKLPRSTRVKNKTAAPIQITAEQILREARQRQENHRPPKQKITDSDELANYRLRKRKGFEDVIRRSRWNTGVWVKYASWEESQGDFARARSIWERLLDVDYRNPTLWLKYAEMEMRHRFINHGRDVWDRAVALLPRVDQLWYKYIHMFELRYDEVDRARAIYERLVVCHPRPSSFIKYAKFEAKRGEIARARAVYERAIDLNLSEDDVEAEQLFVAFAGFEMWCKETERARCIYRYALDHVPKGRAKDLYHEYDAFEKQYGDTAAMEDAIIVREDEEVLLWYRKEGKDVVENGKVSEMAHIGVMPCRTRAWSIHGRTMFHLERSEKLGHHRAIGHSLTMSGYVSQRDTVVPPDMAWTRASRVRIC
ncbi:hypothetical protein ZIOFF_017067 [Zingiber officinale]|uniref:Pre-mRNA-splicing factor Syf1/CRNKL1-like C-terminal HAT-repeats domain-containing protein n=1 Tax=Zingiber officinale TaxID=94328 RepID=A0A8J5HHY8_ZINOF|nr:hypothetical protein ZIOFF_017067 [Zingiber officinale]